VQEEASVPGTAVGESAPELPTQRDPETAAQQALFELPEQTAHGAADGAPTGAAQDPDADGPTSPASPSASPPSEPLLGARERAVLDFERRPWKRAGAKDEAIRTEFGISPTNYFQILNALLDDPAALAYNPTLVARLRRRREARQQARG
jgi:hypothetical protein